MIDQFLNDPFFLGFLLAASVAVAAPPLALLVLIVWDLITERR